MNSASCGLANIAFVLVLLSALTGLTGCGGPAGGLQHDPAASLAEARQQRALAPHEPYWPYQMALQHAQSGAPELARAAVDTALALDADYAPAVALLSKLQYEAGEYEAAAALLEHYIAGHPTAPDALRVAWSLNLQALHETEQATAVLAGCAAQSGAVQTARACALLRSDSFRTALPAAQAAVADNSRSAANHNNLGISLLYAGQPAEARAAFLRALELEPGLPGSLYNLAIVENFYFFDRAAGREYFRRYQRAARQLPPADPDELQVALEEAAGVVGDQAALAASHGEGNR